MPAESLPGSALSLEPIVEILQQTPRILQAWLEAAPRESLDWKPKPERWSISEVLAHLKDVEVNCFRLRAHRYFQEAAPEFEPYDQNQKSAAGLYTGRDPRKSLADFTRERAESLELLKNVAPDLLARRARHPKLGGFTLAEMLNEWAFHDLGHIRQIAELYRARVFWPAMGPTQQSYTINP